MVLMSSLLLWALVALLPQTLGSKPVVKPEIKINETKMIGQLPLPHKPKLLHSNFPLVSAHSPLQSVFTDIKCAQCINCMEKAIKANKIHTHISNDIPNNVNQPDDVLTKSFREKRSAEMIGETSTIKAQTSKKMKTKKNKAVTVTKYNIDGQVFALKIKDGILNSEDQEVDTTCQVYSVKKYFPCSSPEGSLMLTNAKRKVSKRNQKAHEKKNPVFTTVKTVLSETPSKAAKREVDNTQILEQYMTSIEDLY